jgi:hypothetical protein
MKNIDKLIEMYNKAAKGCDQLTPAQVHTIKVLVAGGCPIGGVGNLPKFFRFLFKR